MLDIVCQALPTASKGGEHGQRGRKAPGSLEGRERDILTLLRIVAGSQSSAHMGPVSPRPPCRCRVELKRTMPRKLADTGKGHPHALGNC